MIPKDDILRLFLCLWVCVCLVAAVAIVAIAITEAGC